MNRIFILAALILLYSSNAFASFTVAEICSGAHGGGGSSDTKATCTGTATAGQTVAMLSQNEGAATITASDNGGGGAGSTYVNLTIAANGGNRSQWSYTLSQVGSGSVTYTSTWSGSTGGSIIVIGITGSGTVAWDNLDVQGTGTSTAADSGANVTTTTTDGLVLAGCSNENNPALSAFTINGVAATTSTKRTNSQAFWKDFATALTNQHALATVTPSDKWMVPVLAFKNTGGGGDTPTTQRIGTMGVGR